MYRAGLLGLFAVILCSTTAQAQMNPNQTSTAPDQPGVRYVLSEQVTCTCGQVNENYVGGTGVCSACGTPLPEPPGAETVTDVSQVTFNQPSDFVASHDGSIGEYEYVLDGCEPNCNECDSCRGGGNSLFQTLSKCRCLSGGSCNEICCMLRTAPPMLGGGFGGGGPVNLRGTRQSQFLFQNAIGSLVGPYAGANSSVIYDVAGNVANPDYQSVGIGSQVGGFWQFAVVESIPAPDGLLPPGATFVSGNATQVTQAAAGIITTGDLWDLLINANQNFNLLIPNAANAGAAVVGRSRIADNNSPLPRTRVYLNYDLLDSVPLQSGGTTVSRFTPGIEYALGKQQRSSFEVRIPFATTLSTDILANGGTPTGRAEFGDFMLAYKHVLCQSTDYALSGGVAVTLPSADDLSVINPDGTKLVFVENQAIHLMPFLASTARWTDRVFSQSFLQFDMDTHGSQVYVNDGATQVGRLRDTTRLYTDFALGYWLRRPGENATYSSTRLSQC